MLYLGTLHFATTFIIMGESKTEAMNMLKGDKHNVDKDWENCLMIILSCGNLVQKKWIVLIICHVGKIKLCAKNMTLNCKSPCKHHACSCAYVQFTCLPYVLACSSLNWILNCNTSFYLVAPIMTFKLIGSMLSLRFNSLIRF
jgi:hypothetical protein